jgi:hypothetical protein
MTKIDLDQIAHLEKLFVEEYGDQSIKDFRAEWNPGREEDYLEQLKRQTRRQDTAETKKVEISGVLITERTIERKSDRVCPVCETYSFSRRDDLFMNRFSCCYECHVEFVDKREERWTNGWRPDEDRIKSAIKRRKR